MIKIRKLGGVTAVLTALFAAITACTTTIQPVQPASEPANQAASRPTDQPTVEPERPSPTLPDLGQAPEIRNEVWINTDRPVTLADSRGKVVLLEFWTFG
ncbi:MAG: hypothetical protein P8183_10380 [Anaerolineae bacterium]